MKNSYLAASAAIIILVIGFWLFSSDSANAPTETPEVVREEKSPTTESKPKQQAAPKVTTPAPKPAEPTPTEPTPPAEPPAPKITYVNTSEADIFNVLPRAGDTVTAGITVSGSARGDWFTQGAFWVEVIAENGDVLIRNQVPSKGNSMTTGMVQFSSSVLISPNYHGPATVRLVNDNPPGHPNPDRSVSIPVVVK